MSGKKVTIFLINGTPEGPRTIEIGTWNGHGFYSSRAAISSVINRTEFSRPGVYILKSQSTAGHFTERVYIGEAEDIGKRLRDHIRNDKIQFEELAFFTSSDSSLTKAHVKYLESRLIEIALEAKNAQIENGKASKAPSLSEADISVMEDFIEQIKLILPTMGFSMLKPITSTIKNDVEYKMRFKIKTPQYNAQMGLTDNSYIVLKGSEANKITSDSISNGWKLLREGLLEKGFLIDNGDKFVFTVDTRFDSASAASSIVLGRQSAGTTEWIDENGKSLKELQ